MSETMAVPSDVNGSIVVETNINFFDLKYVHDNFVACLINDGDISLDMYLNAYRELQKFCNLMGTVFGFVGSEIGSKMDALEQVRAKDKSGHFSTMKKMVEYETENGLLKESSYVSGSRTLLRLHRGLDFLRQFLKRVGELQPEEKTNTVGQEVYNQTLAKYHPWLVRKGAVLAMYVLPTRNVLLHRVCGENTQSALDALPEMLESTNEVYNRTENYFKEMDLLNLP
ncbi:ceramide-1-phosphate transfer protein-like [Macrosteles quadrilineatus]|uniref:ceramide-1-phosphate transfer protein-like n=1 Tax=Macrosteles quadrilineatus TaxID=74068 RepID=UPI0023E0B2D4|nr:ceramide-1-phosphate transfer protein-like [Macrosteles quadrilineatus]